MANAQTYLIMEGVRRAKAWEQCGATRIVAQVLYPDGTSGPIINVDLDQLLSPKMEIDLTDPQEARRYWYLGKDRRRAGPHAASHHCDARRARHAAERCLASILEPEMLSMLQPDKTMPGLFAIHLILVKARLLSHEKAEHAKLYDILDWAELLPALMARADDTTAEFREALEALGQRHADFAGIVVNFDRNVAWVSAGAPAHHEANAAEIQATS